MKNFFNFQLATKLPEIGQYAKTWTVLRLVRSCQLEFVKTLKIKRCLGGLKDKFFKNGPDFPQFFENCPEDQQKSPKLTA